ncbi:g2487 [Coccomyxa viridis]|uniref:alpha-1,2-Mannosidase n=1 Tax=Coccomyxa viridis TaxID=1274662 RepID=A0ABP1FKH9_9CHLO
MRTALLSGLLVTVLWWVSAENSQQAGAPTGREASGRFFGGRWFPREGRVSDEELQALREEARSMFDFGFHNYLQHGFPKASLLADHSPSWAVLLGHDSQGGVAITLIDALDTLLVMDREEHLVSAVHWLDINLSFDLDARVHVFELTIRALGSLLSTHVLLANNLVIMPEYNSCLLRLATELGDRLLPAFNTPHGIPLSWVNLRNVRITFYAL